MVTEVVRGRAVRRRVLRPGALRRGRGGQDPRGLEYAVLDVETTGLDPAAGARICELAVVRVRGDGAVLAEFSTLVAPRVPVTGTEFHGIGDADVVGAPTSAALVGRLVELLSGAVVVGHKLEFEEAFLASEMVPAGLPTGLPGLCTLRTLRAQLDLERYSLPRASHTLSGRWPGGQHTALGDARSTARLLVELLHNAPAPLGYTGPEPVRVPVPVTAVRTVHGKSRQPFLNGTAPGGSAPRVPAAARWRPDRWRSRELDPARCGGRFDAEQRSAAVEESRVRERRSELVGFTAALVAGAATAAAAASVAGGVRGLLNGLVSCKSGRADSARCSEPGQG